MLEIRNLNVKIEDKQILNGLTLTVNDGEVAAIMDRTARGSRRSPTSSPERRTTRSSTAKSCSTGRTSWR